MKKVILLLTIIVALVMYYDVNAKDIVSQETKYNEDTYQNIIDSYDEKGNIDGHIISGTYINDNKKEEVLIVKYNKEEKIEWTYANETKDSDNILYSINYLYENNNIIGYLVSIREEDISYFLKINLDGKLIEKIEQASNQTTKVMKEVIINDNFYGYITAGQVLQDDKNIGVITKYNNNLEAEWIKYYNNENYSELSVNDIITNIDDENILGYNIILTYKEGNKNFNSLIKLDSMGEEISTIKDDFEENDIPKLEKIRAGYIVYGYTNEIKLNKDKSQSYYLIKYNNNDEVEWETVGNINIDLKKAIKIQTIKENNQETYLLMATNKQDTSLEITKINQDGAIENKIKKINNNYYDIKTFLYNNNIIYFVGQINCVEDDVCTYNRKSLYLISDEDKVIEVKDNDSKAILIITILLVISTAIIIIVKRKKLCKN